MIWVLLPLLFGLVFAEVRCHQRLRRLTPHQTSGLFSGARLLPDILVLSALGLILFSLQPTLSTTLKSEPGPAIALVVDVSRSMQVTDQKPDRISVARHELLTLIDNYPEARFSLIPFTGEAVLQVPLTNDHAGLRFFINNLHTGLINSKGSAPEEAVLLAQRSLQSTRGKRLVVLISDGERTVGEQPPRLSPSIPVYSILVGTTAGGLVNNNTDSVSRADSERLVSMTHQTGGRPLTGNISAPAVLTLPIGKSATETTETSSALLGITLLLIIIRWAPTSIAGRHLLYVPLLLLIPLFPGCENYLKPVESTRSQFEQGLQTAYSGETESALKMFAAAAENCDGKQRATALYNLGTVLLVSGRPNDAIDPLEQALILLPGDQAIRDNLLLALSQTNTITTEGQGEPESHEIDTGEEMSPQQAQQLLDSVQLDPTAPLTEATLRPPTVLKEW